MSLQGIGEAMEAKDEKEENMAAWLLGIETLKIQPFVLPLLGKSLSCFCFYIMHKLCPKESRTFGISLRSLEFHPQWFDPRLYYKW